MLNVVAFEQQIHSVVALKSFSWSAQVFIKYMFILNSFVDIYVKPWVGGDLILYALYPSA